MTKPHRFVILNREAVKNLLPIKIRKPNGRAGTPAPTDKIESNSAPVADAFRVPNPSLPLPMGEVSERSEDGEGNKAP